MFGDDVFAAVAFADFSGLPVVFIYYSPVKLRTKVVLVSPVNGKLVVSVPPISIRTKVEKYIEDSGEIITTVSRYKLRTKVEEFIEPDTIGRIKIKTNLNKG